VADVGLDHLEGVTLCDEPTDSGVLNVVEAKTLSTLDLGRLGRGAKPTVLTS
jgi:hypothetical protein